MQKKDISEISENNFREIDGADDIPPDYFENNTDGEDYTITLEGNVGSTKIINLCTEDFNITGKVTNSAITTSEGDGKSDSVRGKVSINGNIDKSKISNPCDKELIISGNVTDSTIIHAPGNFC